MLDSGVGDLTDCNEYPDLLARQLIYSLTEEDTSEDALLSPLLPKLMRLKISASYPIS